MEDKKFFRIRLSTLRPEKTTNFDVYIQIDGKKHLYLHAGDKLSDGKIASLQSKDTGESFFVEEKDREIYRTWIKEELNSDMVNNEAKAVILRESSIALMEDLFDNPDVNKALDEAKPIITNFVDFIKNAPEAVGFMLSLSGHDFYTYNHSLDVSIYSLGLGQTLSFDRQTMEALGMGALFHDIGKRNVPLDILCKKGGLSDSEWEQMKMHTQFGLVILNNHPDMGDDVKAACFEHHESWAGNGYPQQIVGNEIHPFARIVAIADTYDAMTTQRSYNVPLKPVDAVTMMKEKLAGRYDPEMIKALYSVLFKLGRTG
jgi:HD-GYP domain-containing protein (c-di-GMP phosphodiesterase class II)